MTISMKEQEHMPGEMAFPEAKLKALEEKISHSRWVVPVLPEQELEALLNAATDLAAKGEDVNNAPCQRFYNDALTVSFTKILTDDAVSSWKNNIQQCVRSNCEKLVKLCAIKLDDPRFLHMLSMVFNPNNKDELNKPASSLYVHNLTCTLETAVRATNAQFEPPHVLARLHVNLYPNCDGRDDCGWDVFALQYRVDGPLGTLFPATCAARYRALFTQLWRVKRIEYGLHDAWRQHTILHKRLKYLPEVWGLMRRVSCLRAEALRLCGALQEASCVGAEPAWAELRQAAAERHDLDQLLLLHHRALDRHSTHAMIHHTTQELQSYLGNVLNETLALRSFEATLHSGINAELERRERIEQVKEERVARGEFPITAADEALDKEKRKIFHQFLASRKADLNVWARTYRGHVTTLILKLALHAEVSLQTLAFRLDYSDFYKRGDAKLHEPLTYQHKRLSEIGLNLARSKIIDRSKRK